MRCTRTHQCRFCFFMEEGRKKNLREDGGDGPDALPDFHRDSIVLGRYYGYLFGALCLFARWC